MTPPESVWFGGTAVAGSGSERRSFLSLRMIRDDGGGRGAESDLYPSMLFSTAVVVVIPFPTVPISPREEKKTPFLQLGIPPHKFDYLFLSLPLFLPSHAPFFTNTFTQYLTHRTEILHPFSLTPQRGDFRGPSLAPSRFRTPPVCVRLCEFSGVRVCVCVFVLAQRTKRTFDRIKKKPKNILTFFARGKICRKIHQPFPNNRS